MALVRWDPAREVDTLQSEVNRLFDTFFGGPGDGGGMRRWVPAMDLLETDDHLVLRADLPGLDREDVNLEIKDGVLTVSGERRAEHEERGKNFYRAERAFGSFSRSLTLPEHVDAEKISADFEKGVLEIRIPKPEERKPQRIRIGSKNVEGKATEK
ncbi:MAG TPA: Hsp20/alpha crystallin family protein [Solirubrobacterales bacterium]|jgi:HSP20 family protein|nr:Hsp20/alpha crystallin family protein [Solirubrobacterales bacterium]